MTKLANGYIKDRKLIEIDIETLNINLRVYNEITYESLFFSHNSLFDKMINLKHI